MRNQLRLTCVQANPTVGAIEANLDIVRQQREAAIGKQAIRRELARRTVEQLRLPLIYLNQIGSQDELVFDGGSSAVDQRERALT